ncbi:hypothetical protein OIU74_003605 [Salix koriyanagi]|uniref:Uncharacterized protein n=1 Tax=Salix koriyanagi TaxID=2511006 RepID=A0A9Q0ZL94_9ROSI|nr:hypothetical protein OIU74_003605 [Salix koriyanagi]
MFRIIFFIQIIFIIFSIFRFIFLPLPLLIEIIFFSITKIVVTINTVIVIPTLCSIILER